MIVHILNQFSVIGLDQIHRLPGAAAQLEQNPLRGNLNRAPRGSVKLPVLEFGEPER